MTLWLTILGMGIISFTLRFSFIYLAGKIKLPAVMQQALKFVPVAVLPAIVVSAIVYTDGTLDLSITNARIPATLIAAGVAWRTRNILLTLSVGMIALWLWQWGLGLR
ncbi:MAG: AzlD domain-containing protein [Elainellaceae cyanobacterium]